MIDREDLPANHREFLILGHGGLQRVVTIDGELVPWDEWKRRELERSVRRCACGQVCAAGSARTCGSRECIDRLAAQTR
jgi:hypothetical protein